MIQLLVAYSVKAALVLALTGGLAWLMRRATAAIRHLVWTAGLATAFLVLPLSFVLPELHLGLVEAGVAGTALNLLVLTCLAGAAALIARIAADQLALNRLAAEIVTDQGLIALAKATAAQMGVTRAVRLRHWNGPVPATFGTLRPTILLPAAAASWPAERARLVLLHEMAHVARFDAATVGLARIAGAVHWFNPLSWWGLRRMRIECEQACDDLVLRAGAEPIAYARILLESIDDSRTGARQTGALSMTSAESLERRLTRILSGKADRPPRPGLPTATAAIAIAAAAFLLAPLRFETAGYGVYASPPATK
jgi:beta-lactamase regulating signal transducer with metallopeptidase domain